MTIYLKQSTASQEVPLGIFVDSTDGDTEENGLTIANTDIKVWKTGATTLASKNSGGATNISNGIYYCVLDATDTNTLGSLVLFIHVAGALAVKLECLVLAANIYDSMIGGGDFLDVSTVQIAGQTASAAGTVTFPGTVASTTNITAGTITTTTNLTNAVSSVTGAVGSVTGNVGGNVVGNVNGSVASVTAAVTLTPTERDAVADALLNRDMSTGTDSGSTTVRTPRQAFRILRNKVELTGVALVVYKENDTTQSWTGTVTTNAAALPITANDPA